MGTTVSIIIGAIGVLGSIIYLINETIKVRREPEKREELYRLRKEEEKNLLRSLMLCLLVLQTTLNTE